MGNGVLSLKEMSLRGRAIVGMGLILLLFLLNMGLCIYIDGVEHNHLVVESIVGEQSLAIHQMAFDSVRLYHGDENAKQSIREWMTKFDDNIARLESAKPPNMVAEYFNAILGGNTLFVPDEVLRNLDDHKSDWWVYERNLEVLISEPPTVNGMPNQKFIDAYNYVTNDENVERIHSFYENMDESVAKYAQERVTFTKGLSMLMFIAMLAVLFIMLLLITGVGRSIGSITTFMTAVAGGNLDAELEVSRQSFVERMFPVKELNTLTEAGLKLRENLRKKINELKQKGEEIQNVLNGVGTPVIWVDKDFTIKMANEAAAAVAGKKPEDVIGLKCYQLFNTPHCRTDECRVKQAMMYKEPRKGETVSRVNGREIPIMYKATPLLDENGEVIGAVEYTVNLTEQKRKEKELIETFKGFPRPGYVYFIDTNGVIKYASDAFAKDFVGYESAESIIGKRLSEVLGVKTIAEKVLETGREIIGKEMPAKTKDGRKIYLLVSGIPIRVDNELIGALGFLVDITDLKEKEKEIKEEKEYVERVVNALLPVVEAAAEGDLTQEITIETRDGDALDRLVKAFEDMRSGLRSIIENLSEAVNKLSSASEELSASIEEINSASKSVSESAQKISAGAEEQTSLIEKANKLMEEISGITEETASSAESVLNIATEAEKAAMEGVESSNNVIRNMDSLAQANQLVTQEVEELVKKAEQIGEIVDIITKIAEQTSLLALNANIEAARVGEQGRGFAVVAGEVGKLANETQESAKSIAALIKEIQDSMHKLAESVQNSSMKTENAVRSVSDIVEKIEKIREVIEETATGMREIKRAMDDQANAVQNLASLSDRVYQVALENAREVENTAAAAEEQASSIDEITRAAEELARMAEGLLKIVQRFKVE